MSSHSGRFYLSKHQSSPAQPPDVQGASPTYRVQQVDQAQLSRQLEATQSRRLADSCFSITDITVRLT